MPTSRLNETGRAQSRGLLARLGGEPIAAVYSSDLRRASETAQIVASELGVSVELDRRLREIDVGSWQGRTRAELDGTPWDGETYDEHRARAVAAMRSIAERHPGQSVLVVAHGGTCAASRRPRWAKASPSSRTAASGP